MSAVAATRKRPWCRTNGPLPRSSAGLPRRVLPLLHRSSSFERRAVSSWNGFSQLPENPSRPCVLPLYGRASLSPAGSPATFFPRFSHHCDPSFPDFLFATGAFLRRMIARSAPVIALAVRGDRSAILRMRPSIFVNTSTRWDTQREQKVRYCQVAQ